MIGQRLNNYEIKARLGEGGMGTVYLAEHPFMRRKAAIKVLRRSLAEDPNLVVRFMNEARAANAVRHPNIIDIMDVGTFPDGVPYLLMEFLDGETLGTRLARVGRLPLAKALEIVRQTGSALAAAHAAGIVHRDLKPDNLFLVSDGTIPGDERIKVLDFGIAKLRSDVSGGTSETSNGVLLGTPFYMSPEQCRGLAAEIDLRTDIYALGVIAYEMLCGSPPFQSEGAGDLLIKHITMAPEPPRARNPEIPPHVEAAILKALAKTPQARFAGMDDFVSAMMGAKPLAQSDATTRSGKALSKGSAARASSEAETIRAPTPPARRHEEITTFRTGAGEVTPLPPGEPPRRRRSGLLFLAGAVFLVAGTSAALVLRDPRVPPPPPPKSASGAPARGVPAVGAPADMVHPAALVPAVLAPAAIDPATDPTGVTGNNAAALPESRGERPSDRTASRRRSVSAGEGTTRAPAATVRAKRPSVASPALAVPDDARPREARPGIEAAPQPAVVPAAPPPSSGTPAPNRKAKRW